MPSSRVKSHAFGSLSFAKRSKSDSAAFGSGTVRGWPLAKDEIDAVLESNWDRRALRRSPGRAPVIAIPAIRSPTAPPAASMSRRRCSRSRNNCRRPSAWLCCLTSFHSMSAKAIEVVQERDCRDRDRYIARMNAQAPSTKGLRDRYRALIASARRFLGALWPW